MKRPRNKEEYRQRLAESFAHVLEDKGLDWKKEWGSGSSAPVNAVTKARYRGTNAFGLALISMINGYDDPRWVTMVQIMDQKGTYHPKEKWHLKAGTEATYVEYWFPFDVKKKKALTWEEHGEELKNGRNETEFVLSTRYTAVFNASQVEGMPKLPKQGKPDISPDELLMKLSKNMGVPILNDGGDGAFYSPKEDKIHLPVPESFYSEYAYNSTALHELAHATGHATRLNRSFVGLFGTPEYAYEELIAEITSALMGADLSTEAESEHVKNHKAYVQNWISVIRNKPEMLAKAIKEAQTAACFLDWKAELITEQEFQKEVGMMKTIQVREREIERGR
jgi:antirestriction protein ArdC